MSAKTAEWSPAEDAHVMRAEHDVQIELLRALEDAVTRRQPKTQLKKILRQLTDYTSVHFLSEQLLMRLYAYPDYEQHEQRHAQLMEHVDALQESLAAGDRERTLTMLQHFQDGILGHINHDDAALARYLQGGLAAHR